jgi:hypothetical protein
LLGALSASAILLVSAVGPISAAPATTSSPWKDSGSRAQTTRNVASARDAAKKAVGSPRTVAAKPRLPSVKLDRPSAVGSASLPNQPALTAPTPQAVSGPDVEVLQQFAGVSHSEGGGDPPDPWVAVNSSYVVQSVDSVVRVSNRSGVEVESIPTWALFALPVGQSPADTRIIWDTTHGRWVAVNVSFNAGLTDNFLNLAVSDGANPTAGWTTYSVAFGDDLPDYPSLASSSDKIVVTDNLFDATSTPVGADLNTWTWSSILAGGSATYNFCTTDDGWFNARAAQVLSPSNDVHLIMEAVPSGNQWYSRVTGVGSCGQVIDATHLSVLEPFAVPPAPRQLTSDTISDAVDERPTDAIWQNGAMWWVSTYPFSYDGGATVNAAVVLWNVTTVSSGPPINPTGQPVAPGDGFDTFMGGIGMSRNGTLFTVYSQSSDSNFVYMMADQIASGPGEFLGEPIQLEYGDESAASERWGDFAGVAMDPVGSGTVWATHQLAAGDGSWRTEVLRLVADDDSPTLPGVPAATLVTPADLLGTIPVRLSWTASTDATSGVAKYEIAQSIDGGAFGAVTPVTGTTTIRQLEFNHTYRFQVRAVDTAGNVGGFRVGPTLRPSVYQQASGTVYGGTWATSNSSSYSGGSVRYAGTAGKSVTFTTTGVRSIGFVSTKAPSRGSFKVYADGVYKGTFGTYSTTTKFRQLVYQYTWATPGTHKLKIVVSGTAGHPRIDIDAFVVIR